MLVGRYYKFSDFPPFAEMYLFRMLGDPFRSQD